MQISNVFDVRAASQQKSVEALSSAGPKDAFEKELSEARGGTRPSELRDASPREDGKQAPGAQVKSAEDASSEAVSSKDAKVPGENTGNNEEAGTKEMPRADNDAAGSDRSVREDGQASVVVVSEMQVAMALEAQPAPVERASVPQPEAVAVSDGMAMAIPESGTIVPAGRMETEAGKPVTVAAEGKESKELAETAVGTSGTVKEPLGGSQRFENVSAKAAASEEKGTMPDTSAKVRVASAEAEPQETTFVPADPATVREDAPALYAPDGKTTASPEAAGVPVPREADAPDRVERAAGTHKEKQVVAPDVFGRAVQAEAVSLPANGTDDPEGTEQPPEVHPAKRRAAEKSGKTEASTAASVDTADGTMYAADQAVKTMPSGGKVQYEAAGNTRKEGHARARQAVANVPSSDAPDERSVTPGLSGSAAAQPQQAAPAKEIVIPAPASPDVNAMIGQIVKQAKIAVQDNRSEMVIRLQPGNLGTLNMTIVTENDSVSVRIQVDNKAVKDMLESNIGQLTGSLNSQGMKVDGLGITVAPRPADTAFGFNGFGWGGMTGHGASQDNSWARYSGNYVPAGMAADDPAGEYRSLSAAWAGRMAGSSGAVDYLV